MVNKSLSVFCATAIGALAFPLIAGCQSAPSQPAPHAAVAANRPVSTSSTTPAGAAIDFQYAAENSVKAVVHIKTATKARTVVARDPMADMFGEDFGNMFGNRHYYMPPQNGSGSGVVITPDGYIVTNNHVVAGADKLTVTFNDGYIAQAQVVGTDPATDIAVLKINEKNLPYLAYGNSDEVKLGQWVLAVGYPLTLDATVTAGIVSAKSRSIGINSRKADNAIESFIQTDAAVNPGNSGGALVNTDGRLIGINSAIASPTGSYAGYSYAIPANIVQKVATDIIQYGSAQRAYLGIQYLDMTRATPEQLQSLGISRSSGVYIAGVAEEGGAAAAGLQKGDFITAINGTSVNTQPELLEQIARYKPGDRITVAYVRGKTTKTTTVELKNISGTTSIVRKPSALQALGMDLKALSNEEQKKYRVGKGVVITEINPAGLLAQQTNLRKGFVITTINGNQVATPDDVQKAVSSAGAILQLGGFFPGNSGTYYFTITNPDNPSSSVEDE
jgi:Do/DeqQ family serine protease